MLVSDVVGRNSLPASSRKRAAESLDDSVGSFNHGRPGYRPTVIVFAVSGQKCGGTGMP